jgi:saccharopine dehydrogenase (NAD+, L-lysine forming)
MVFFYTSYMQIFLIGAGSVGSLLLDLLNRDTAITSIICGSDIFSDVFRMQTKKSKKIKLVSCNAANPSELIRLGAGSNVLINASLPQFNISVMNAAVELRAHYLDFCSYLENYKDAEQLEMHDTFRKHDLLGLINTGVSPGLSNILARELAEKFESVSDITFRVLEEHPDDDLTFFFSPMVSIDEVLSPPLIYRNNEFHLTEPFAEEEIFQFPMHGKKTFFTIYGDEVATLPSYISAKNITYKAGGGAFDTVKFLYGLGFFSRFPVTIFGKEIIPEDFIEHFFNHRFKTPTQQVSTAGFFGTSIEVKGLVNSEKKIATATVLSKEQNITTDKAVLPIVHQVASAGFAFLKVLPKISDRGVLPPEALSNDIRKILLQEFQYNNFRVHTVFA